MPCAPADLAKGDQRNLTIGAPLESLGVAPKPLLQKKPRLQRRLPPKYNLRDDCSFAKRMARALPLTFSAIDPEGNRQTGRCC